MGFLGLMDRKLDEEVVRDVMMLHLLYKHLCVIDKLWFPMLNLNLVMLIFSGRYPWLI